MSRRKAPPCPRCHQPMKRVFYGMPAKPDFDKYIYAGCDLGGPVREWDCLCVQDEEDTSEIPSIQPEFQIIVGDITALQVDAIVNAANPQLAKGGGVCGAIHAVAGLGLEAECRERYPNGIEIGQAAITGGHNSLAKWIVHAVAPRADSSGTGDHAALAMAYQNAIRLADEAGAKTIAFPSLGTGIYGWDVEKAAGYALLDGIFPALSQTQHLAKVILCCFTREDANVYGRNGFRPLPD